MFSYHLCLCTQSNTAASTHRWIQSRCFFFTHFQNNALYQNLTGTSFSKDSFCWWWICQLLVWKLWWPFFTNVQHFIHQLINRWINKIIIWKYLLVVSPWSIYTSLRTSNFKSEPAVCSVAVRTSPKSSLILKMQINLWCTQAAFYISPR